MEIAVVNNARIPLERGIVETVSMNSSEDQMGQKYSFLAGHMPPAILSIFNRRP